MPCILQTLTSIWERLLGRSPIGLQENFFEMHGTHLQADAMFVEIERTFGKKWPTATLFHAPTIEKLAALLEQPELPHFSPYVKIKEGTEQPPVFIAHGLSGLVEFYELVKYIHIGNPIYGIQAQGIDGQKAPLDRVEDMATLYLDALREIWPNGPYIFIGYSFGGLVALEMARRLSEQGKTIALLALLDTYPHPRYIPRDLRARLFLQRVRHHASTMQKLSLPSAASYFVRGLRHRVHVAEALAGEGIAPPPPGSSLAATAPLVNQLAYRACATYQPKPYRGKVRFMAAATKSFFNDPARIWTKLISDLEIEIAPGDHLTLVTTQFQTLAEILTRYISEATASVKG